ncbi:MAG: hypothetical protein HY716_16475 [Planctomycetes bacterium]|nr:hypothetical protein [Planctomycetota bacterium]
MRPLGFFHPDAIFATNLFGATPAEAGTNRVTAGSLLDGNCIDLIGKGGKRMTFTISSELYRELTTYLSTKDGPLADQRGYQSAYARAIRAAGGRVTGTHGLRRLSAQQHYSDGYRVAAASGLPPGEAARLAAGNTVERLGHGRNRSDVSSCYLGRKSA